jgi:hypothetical protein
MPRHAQTSRGSAKSRRNKGVRDPSGTPGASNRKKNDRNSEFRPSLNREASRLGDVRIRRPSSREQVPETLAADRDPLKLVATSIAHPEDGLSEAGVPAGIRRPSSAKKAMLSNRQYLPRHPDAPTHKVSSVSIGVSAAVFETPVWTGPQDDERSRNRELHTAILRKPRRGGLEGRTDLVSLSRRAGPRRLCAAENRGRR